MYSVRSFYTVCTHSTPKSGHFPAPRRPPAVLPRPVPRQREDTPFCGLYLEELEPRKSHWGGRSSPAPPPARAAAGAPVGPEKKGEGISCQCARGHRGCLRDSRRGSPALARLLSNVLVRHGYLRPTFPVCVRPRRAIFNREHGLLVFWVAGEAGGKESEMV